MEKEINIEKIKKSLIKYWSKKINKPCADLYSIRATVYDELLYANPCFFKTIKRDQINDIAISIKKSI